MSTAPNPARPRLVSALMETFGFSLKVAFVVAGLLVLLAVAAIWWIVASAPPRTLTITTGPEGSTFQRYAESYQKALKDKGVTLVIRPSQGSQENLQRLLDPHSGVDLGFVQGGLALDADVASLVSLGSVSYQPLWLFYRSNAKIITRLSELAGKRIAVGPKGSGTRTLAMTLLQANGVNEGGETTFADVDAGAAAAALLAGKLDAVFLMGDSAPIDTLKALVRSTDVQMYSFTQADAYTRRLPYLNRIVLPEGSIDFGKDLPAQNVVLVGPTVELVARKGLHPGVTDVLLEAAQDTHGKPSLLAKRGEFPAPLEHEFKISDEAKRFYKSGAGMLYGALHSIWLASIVNRVLVVFVPFLLVTIPAVRLLPIIYKLRIQLRIYRCYRPLLALERNAAHPLTRERGEELLQRLDEVEHAVNRLKVPASFGEQFYALKGHVLFVRERLKQSMRGPAPTAAGA